MTSMMRNLMSGCLMLAALSIAPAMAEEGWWELELAGQTFRLERVADPESRTQGLMGRELASDEGMLFDFPAGTVPAIWMRNMKISLDLVYADDQGQIAHIFPSVPPCRSMPCEIYRAERPLRFVLELPAGTAQRLDLRVGQALPMAELVALPVPAQ